MGVLQNLSAKLGRVMKNELVNDITCISCLDCVDACNVKGSIEYKPIIKTLVERWKK